MNGLALWAILAMLAIAGLEVGSPGVVADTVKAAAMIMAAPDLPRALRAEQDRLKMDCHQCLPRA